MHCFSAHATTMLWCDLIQLKTRHFAPSRHWGCARNSCHCSSTTSGVHGRWTSRTEGGIEIKYWQHNEKWHWVHFFLDTTHKSSVARVFFFFTNYRLACFTNCWPIGQIQNSCEQPVLCDHHRRKCHVRLGLYPSSA